MQRFLLDTDTCSFLISNRFPEVSQRAMQLPKSALMFSSVTRAELLYGVRLKASEKLERLVTRFLAEFDCQAWDSACADVHASLRLQLKNSGTPIGGFDTMIAAHALRLGATLVSHNSKHFTRVADLRCVDWVGFAA
jgi:tRNA(fMet)-specific endonuclease VapC